MGNISFKEYSIFYIGKIWVDWPGMDFQFTQDHASGLASRAFALG